MEIVNMHAAKSQLSRLVQRASAGETILIAQAGKPLARLAPLAEVPAASRLGFLREADAAIPEDFDDMGDAVDALFFSR